ncbi:hypothetical protein HYALB_00004181 [Hymenoscyphus albidus]|uniref:Uncharacterized protein n=1 Tax=Hymenoscyphus albidus TaxID=595503 RepID=A0A9N9M2D2_9HELO|nr:hypothetical protein HYALB_00004181 [Hymenoscyphus albidus]
MIFFVNPTAEAVPLRFESFYISHYHLTPSVLNLRLQISPRLVLAPSYAARIMLEAVAAVGLAGNVVQLVQFSFDLINKVVEIRRGGKSPPLLEPKHIVTLSIQQIKATKIQFTCCAGRKHSLDDKVRSNL